MNKKVIFLYFLSSIYIVSCSGLSTHRNLASKNLPANPSCSTLFQRIIKSIKPKTSADVADELIEEKLFSPLSRDPDYIRGVIEPKLRDHLRGMHAYNGSVMDRNLDRFKIGVMTLETHPSFEVYVLIDVGEKGIPSNKVHIYHPVFDELEEIFGKKIPPKYAALDYFESYTINNRTQRRILLQTIGENKHKFFKNQMSFKVDYPLEEDPSLLEGHRVFINIKKGSTTVYTSWRNEDYYQELLAHPMGRDILTIAKGFIEDLIDQGHEFDQRYLKRITSNNGESFYIIRFKPEKSNNDFFDLKRYYVVPINEGIWSTRKNSSLFVGALMDFNVNDFFKDTDLLPIDLDSRTRVVLRNKHHRNNTQEKIRLRAKEEGKTPRGNDWEMFYFEQGTTEYLERKVTLLELDGGLSNALDESERRPHQGELFQFFKTEIERMENADFTDINLDEDTAFELVERSRELTLLASRTFSKVGITAIQNQMAGILKGFSRKATMSKNEYEAVLHHLDGLLRYEFSILMQIKSANELIQRSFSKEGDLVGVVEESLEKLKQNKNGPYYETLKERLDAIILYSEVTSKTVIAVLDEMIQQSKSDILKVAEYESLLNDSIDQERVRAALIRFMESRVLP